MLNFDESLFIFLNSFGSPSIDEVVYFFSNSIFIWALFFSIPSIFTYKHFKKKGIVLIFIALIGVGLTDFINAKGLKDNIKRPRPCREEKLQDKIYIPFNDTTCAGKYGFPSNHAANAFFIATFFYLLLRKKSKKWGFLFIVSILMSLTRIYLAKHYPFDLIAGAIVGSIIAFIFSFYSRRKYLA